MERLGSAVLRYWISTMAADICRNYFEQYLPSYAGQAGELLFIEMLGVGSLVLML